MARKVHEIAFELAGKIGSSFNSMFTTASSRLAQTNRQLSALQRESKRLEKSLQEGKITADAYAGAYARIEKQLKEAEAAQKKFTKAAKAEAVAQRADEIQGQMQSDFMRSAAAALPFVGAVASGINFDTEMAGVAKQVEGARNDLGELTEIGQEAKRRIMQASKDMMIMPDAIAKAYAMSARSGVKGMDNIDRFARMGTMMGTAFEAPAEQITEDFAKIGSAMSIDLSTKEGIDELEALANTVNYLDDKTNASGADIINVLKRIGGTATALVPTLSKNSLAGISTGLLQMGETSETAGTAINALLTKVAAAPAQSKPFQAALSKVGISAKDLQAGALKDAEGTIMGLFERIGKLDAGTRNNVLAELFGAEHIDTLSKISGNYEQFLKIIKMGNSEAAKGSMAKEFEIMSKTAARQLEGLKTSVARAAVGISDILLPSVLQAAHGLESLIEKAQNFAKEHPKLTEFAVKGVAGMVAFAIAATAVGWAVSAAVIPFARLFGWATKVELATKLLSAAQRSLNAVLFIGRSAMLALSFAMRLNPIGAVITLIAGLIAAGVYLYKNFDTVREYVDKLWDKFKETFPNAAQFIETVGQKVGGLWDKLKGFWRWLKDKDSGTVRTGGGDSGFSSRGVGDLRRLDKYATGGFANRPSIFGDAGWEAAIPLDGSRRSIGLWEKTGELLGVRTGGGEVSVVYAPVINAPGGDPGVIRQVLKESRDDFFARYQAMKHQQRRLAYG